MRTKALLGLAALAVGLTSASAQVYSLNVVGYVNVALEASKLHFLSIPVAPVDGNFNINNTILLDDTQDQAIMYIWQGTQWDPDPPIWYAGQPAGQGWNTIASQPAANIVSNGSAFFIASQAASTLTFVGQVPQGTIPYSVPAGLSTLASRIPVSTNFPGLDVGSNSDIMYTWDQVGQQWDPLPWIFYEGAGWDADGSGTQLDGPVLNPGQGVFYQAGSGISWTRNFTVQ